MLLLVDGIMEIASSLPPLLLIILDFPSLLRINAESLFPINVVTSL